MLTVPVACPLCLSPAEARPEPDKSWCCGFQSPSQLFRCADCTGVYLRGYSAQLVQTHKDDSVRAKIVASCTDLGSQEQLFSHRLEWLARRVSGRRVLDVGCGNGAFLLSARESGWEPSGLDASEAARDLLASTGIEVHVADAVEFLRGHARRFDLIHMNHSLEHIANAADAVLAARAALVPGGVLYVEVPNEFDNFVYRSLELLGRKRSRGSLLGRSQPPSEPSPHLYFFNKKSLSKLAARAGFASFEVHARRREALELTAGELAASLSALLGAGPFLTLVAQAPRAARRG